jgi:hypothetical protein
MTSPSGAHVADVHVDVHPDASGFEAELRRDLKNMVVRAKVSPDTTDFKRELQDKLRTLGDFKVLVAPDTTGFREKLAKSLEKMRAVPVTVVPDTKEFRRELKAKLKGLPDVKLVVDNKAALASVEAVGAAIKALPNTINVDLDTATAAASLATLKAAMQSLSVGSINVDLDTTAATAKIATLAASLKAISAGSVKITVTMPNATSTGVRIGRAAAKEFYKAFKAALAAMPAVNPPVGGPGSSAAAGTRNGGAFAEGFRNAVRAGLRSLPEPTIGAATGPAEQAIRDLRLDLERLSNQTIGVDIDEQSAMRELDRIELELRSIQASAARGTRLNVDTATAEAALRRFREQMRDFGQDPAAAARQGAESGGAFGSAYRRGVETATSHLRPIQINASTDDVTRDIELVRQRLDSLSSQRIGIDIDAAFAVSEIDRLEQDLRRLGAMSPSIQVRADTLAAAAQLAALQQQLRDLGHTRATPTVDVDVDDSGVDRARGNLLNFSSGGRAGIQALIAAGIAIGPAIVPAAAAAAAALAAIGPAAFAGAAGIGVGLLAFKGIGDAVGALGDAQSKAGKTGATYANQQKQIASAQDQVRNAYRGVTEAERNLANAQRDALRAQQDITRAREEAKDALEDLDSSVKNNALSIRQANLDLADAAKELKAVENLPVDDRRRVEAQLQYDQAKQAIDDLTVRQGRLTEEQQKATKAGVEGSEQVRDAQEKASDAQERVRDATVALTRAQEQVISSQRDLKAALVSTSATGGGAVDTLKEKMAALSPAGQAFARFLFQVKDQFKQVKAAAEAGLFPGLQRGIEALLPVLPQIALFVGRVAQAMGNLGEAAGKALASPFWVNFFDYMGQTAGPLLQALGGIIGGLARGFASLLMAFTPFSIQFMRGLAGISQAFADWAANLASSDGFQAFIDYVKAEGPKVLKLFGDFVVAVVKLGIAFAPLGTLILTGLVALFDYLADQDPSRLAAIAAAVGAIGLAIMFFTGGPITAVVAAITAIVAGAVYAYAKIEGVRNAVDAYLSVVGRWFAAVKLGIETFVEAFKRGGDEVQNAGFLGAIEQVGLQARRIFDGIREGVEAFVAGFKKGGAEIQQGGFIAYMQNLGMVARQVFEWLRDTGIPAVAAFLDWIGPKAVLVMKITWAAFETLFTVLNWVFKAIVTVVSWAWNTVIKPIFDAISWVVQNVLGPAFSWLYQNVIQPVWNSIKFAIDVAWASIQVVFGLIQIGIKIMATYWTWLYDNVVKPVWDKLYAAIQAGWNLIKPILELFGNFIKDHVAPKFASAVDGLKGIWGTLSEAAKVPIKFIVDTVLNDGLLAAYNFLADKFNVNPKNVRINVPGLTKAAPAVGGGGGGGGGNKFYARGGPVWGAGTATSDSIPAMLSNGEYVIPANIVRQLGVSFFDQLIGRKKLPYDTNGELKFADGGIVDWAKSAWDTITNPIGVLKEKALGLLDKIPGASEMVQVVSGVGRHIVGGIVDWAKDKLVPTFPGGDNAAAISANASPGFPPWPSASPGRGGTYGDSGVWRSVVALIKSTGPVSGSFGNGYRPGDPKWHGAGRAVDWMGFEQDALAAFLASRGPLELIHRTRKRDYAYSRGRNMGSFNGPLMEAHRNHVHAAFRHGGLAGRDGAALQVPYLFRDQGGYVPPGLSLIDNRTGRDEWMFNDSQMRDLAGNRGGERKRGGDVHIDQFNAYAGQSPHEIARDLDWIGRHGG